MAYIEGLMREAKSSGTPAEKKAGADAGGRVLVDSYADVRVYREPGEPMLLYEVPSPHYRGEEKMLIDSVIELALNTISIDASLTVDEKRQKYTQKITEIIEQTPELRVPLNAKDFYAKAVVREMVGYGIIDPLTQDDQLEEIMIIGPNKPVYVYHRKHEMMRTNVVFYDDQDIKNLVDRIARAIGRRIDLQVPLLDARLKDGTRVNATVPPISIDGSTVTLRKFKKDPLSVIDLINFGTMNYELAAFLWLAADGAGAFPANVLIGGGTASGKTTTLNVMASFVPNTERVVSIEDTAELALPLQHWIRLEVRPPSIEGSGEVDMNDLVKNSIRMRPDRILVGEIRGAEGYTMFAAMNTGHRGVMGTVHANSARETLIRLASPPISVPSMMLSSLNLIVMQNRIHDRRKGTLRRITEVAEVVSTDPENLQLQLLYQWDPVKDAVYATGIDSFFMQMLSRYTGLSKADLAAEMVVRQELLKKMNAQGTRNINDVCAITQNYIPKKKLVV